MRTIEHLLTFPDMACHEDTQHCPLLRTCPVCKRRMVTTKGRRQHQNGCAGTIDVTMAEAQHLHQRQRHGRTLG